MATLPTPSFLLTLPFLLHLPFPVQSLQAYISNMQNDFHGTNSSTVLGYPCSLSDPQSCSTFLTFRSRTNYQSPSQIARLLNADSASIERINRVSDLHLFPVDSLVLVPISCHCTGGYLYQANSSYLIQKDETYLFIANNTYEGLTTCQALMAQNLAHESRNLSLNMNIRVPLRCACPTRHQTSSGIKFLLVYLTDRTSGIHQIASRFNVKTEDVLDANSLNVSSTVFPSTTVLVPLPTEPSPSDPISPPPSPPPPIMKSFTREGSPLSDRKPLIVLIATTVSLLIILGFSLSLFLFFCHRRWRRKEEEYKRIVHLPTLDEKVRLAVLRSLTAYTFEDLRLATDSFSDENRIGSSSVYRASINSGVVAVKRTRGDIQNEISVLNHINHSSTIPLIGFCYGVAENFLVFEFAENGSLSYWLHLLPLKNSDLRLSWNARVKIARNVAEALNYLHNGATPPLFHRNIKSSNILLGRDFKAKLSNFTMARPSCGGGDGDLTAHIVGTRGYLAPEYIEHGLVSAKLDIFAFGMVLIEILSGEAVSDDGKGWRLAAEVAGLLAGEDAMEKLKKFMDPRLGEDYPLNLAFALAQLADRCVKKDYKLRPDSGKLLLALTAIYSSSVQGMGPFKASHSTHVEDTSRRNVWKTAWSPPNSISSFSERS